MWDDLLTTSAQLAMGASHHFVCGPPGTGKSWLIVIILLLRNLLDEVPLHLLTAVPNAAVRTLAESIFLITKEGTPINGAIGRLLGYYEQQKFIGTPLDAAFPLTECMATLLATDGYMAQDMAKPFQHTVKLALIKCLVTDESQMKIGAADQCNNASLESEVRKNGGEIRGTGDWKQINGGRDTDTQRKITLHQHFMHAGGECSHSGAATGPAILTIIEKLLDRAEVDWQFPKSFEATVKQLNNVTAIICAFRKRLFTHRNNYACEKTVQVTNEAGGYPCVAVCKCGKCQAAHNATSTLRRIAEMEDPPGLSCQQTYFDDQLAQKKLRKSRNCFTKH